LSNIAPSISLTIIDAFLPLLLSFDAAPRLNQAVSNIVGVGKAECLLL